MVLPSDASGVKPSVLAAIGNTPLIRLRRASDETGCEILGKAEFLNPGQSVKDRAAVFIVEDAIRRGALRPGGIIVEGTAGNTGIGLALVADAMGFKTVIVIPETQSQEKKDTLRLMGATLVEVAAVPYKNPNNYVKYSARLAEALNAARPEGAIWANQFDNLANRRGHLETTAEEIWSQTEGNVDGFICAVGTGGTLGGVSMGLKAKRPEVTIGVADPPGSAIYSYYATGKLEAEALEWAYQIPDAEALDAAFKLLAEEGLCLGGSSGVNVAGAIRLARDLGPGHTIVTVLCDYGTRYQSKMFNPQFLREKELPVPPWLEAAPSVPEVYQHQV